VCVTQSCSFKEWTNALQQAIKNRGSNSLAGNQVAASSSSPNLSRRATIVTPAGIGFFLENGTVDYTTLAAALLGPGGVETKNRTHMLKTFNDSFLGMSQVNQPTPSSNHPTICVI
jgi:hypothetical protein